MPFALVSCGPKEFDASHSVSIITREDGSGTKSAFMELLGLKGKDDPEEATIQNGTAAVLAEVENNMYAIAYDSLGYVTEDVKLLQVDGVEPTIENIKSGEYAISRPLNVVYKTADIEGSPLYSDYLSFLSSSQAQQIIFLDDPAALLFFLFRHSFFLGFTPSGRCFGLPVCGPAILTFVIVLTCKINTYFAIAKNRFRFFRPFSTFGFKKSL